MSTRPTGPGTPQKALPSGRAWWDTPPPAPRPQRAAEARRLTIDRCARCRRQPATILSMFNLEEICSDCKGREEQHPRYEEARRGEWEAVQRGDLNFPGIGKPSDL